MNGRSQDPKVAGSGEAAAGAWMTSRPTPQSASRLQPSAIVVVGKVVGLLAALATQLMISSFRDLGVIAAATAAH
ncbi:hypothetical protein [Inquilinus sp. OTU3971]|uniref:hypothetical protein n=1 Tax=Inquilinus sp. OTU3971 TaxID=3043855 RepID=UPI00313E890F